nr:MAG TPA: GTPase [Caudoviricetes sp.]
MHHEPCGVYKSDEITKAVTLCQRCHYIRHHTGDAANVRGKCVNYLRALYGDLGAKKE